MWYNFYHLEHLIKLHFCVWCAKCAKNLAFGTFSTSAAGALIIITKIMALILGCSILSDFSNPMKPNMASTKPLVLFSSLDWTCSLMVFSKKGIKDLTVFVRCVSLVFATRYLSEFHQRPTVPTGNKCKATVKWRHSGADELKTNFDGGGVCGDQ